MRTRLWQVLLALVPLAARDGLAARFPSWAEAAVKSYDPQLYQEADAVTLLDEREYVVGISGRRGTRRLVLAIRRKEALSEGWVELVRNEFYSFSKVEAWTRDAVGRVRTYEDADADVEWITNRQGFESGELVTLNPPRVEVGSVIALSHEFRVEPTREHDLWVAQGSSPIVRFRITVTPIDGYRIVMRAGLGANPGPSEATAKTNWELRDLPAIARSNQPDAAEPPRIRLSFSYRNPKQTDNSGDWPSVVREVRGWFDRAHDRGELFEKLAAGLKHEPDLVSAARQRVRELRYFAISLGWGGWIPRAPEEMLQRGVGDCKDKSVLLNALLNQSGYDAVPVLIAPPSGSYVDPTVPSALQFNHAVTGIVWNGRPIESFMTIVESPGLGKLRLIDGTQSSGDRLDTSPWLDGAIGLALDTRTTGVFQLPPIRAETNRTSTECVWQLVATSSLEGSCVTRYFGASVQRVEQAAGEARPASELRTDAFQRLARYCARLSTLEIDPLARGETSSRELRYRFSCNSPWDDLGGFRAHLLPPLVTPDFFPLPTGKDGVPAYSSQLQTLEDRFEIRSRTAFEVPEEAFKIDNSVGTIQLTIERKERSVIVTRRVLNKRRELTVAEQDQIEAARDGVRRINELLLLQPIRDPVPAAQLPHPE